MTNNFEKLFRALRSVSLSERERTNMRISIHAHVRANPIRVNASLLGRIGAYIESAFSSQGFATHPVSVACVLVLVIGVGTSYAAEYALPGEPLYAFKTRVNEPLQGALALSPEAKTEWSAELTFRRLQEAEELAATGDLSTVASADIESGLSAALANFETNIQLLEDRGDIEAANAQSDLEASLNAHEVVLSSLPKSKKSDATRITETLQMHVTTLAKKRTETQATLTATDTPKVKDAALKRKKKAEETLSAVKLLSTKTKDSKLASSTSKVAEQAKLDIKMGENEAKEGRWGKAFSAFEDAARKAKESENSVNTRSWLKSRFGIGVETAVTATSTLDMASTTEATGTLNVLEPVREKKEEEDEDREDVNLNP